MNHNDFLKKKKKSKTQPIIILKCCKKLMRSSSRWILLIEEYSLWLSLLELTLLLRWIFWTLLIKTSPIHPFTNYCNANFDFIILILSALWKNTDRYNFCCCVMFNIAKSCQVFWAPKVLTDDVHVNSKG